MEDYRSLCKSEVNSKELGSRLIFKVVIKLNPNILKATVYKIILEIISALVFTERKHAFTIQ